jgi:agmatine deiminase
MDAAIRRELHGDMSNVRLVRVATQDAWIRDYGPIFVQDRAQKGRQVLLDWGFNSWGGKYPPWDLDDAVPRALGGLLGLPVVTPGMVLEGGSIDVDGEGTLLTTESCLLHRNRNPELSRNDIEARLRQYLGVDRILWLGDGIQGDDTDGHVDDLTRFFAPGRVVTAVESDPKDVNYRPLQENLERLRGMRDAQGRRLEIVELPMPPPLFHQGARCPASYANFLIGNGCVLLPTFGSARDSIAAGILGELFPGRRIVAVPCGDLVWGLGAVHCVSQQQPRE